MITSHQGDANDGCWPENTRRKKNMPNYDNIFERCMNSDRSGKN